MSDGYIGMINCPACMSMHPANYRCDLTTDQRIRDLEREVERLKTAIVDMDGSLKDAKMSYVQGEADRADAERFRWLAMREDLDAFLYPTASIDQVRALIDAISINKALNEERNQRKTPMDDKIEEALREARVGLAMWNMDHTKIDGILGPMSEDEQRAVSRARG